MWKTFDSYSSIICVVVVLFNLRKQLLDECYICIDSDGNSTETELESNSAAILSRGSCMNYATELNSPALSSQDRQTCRKFDEANRKLRRTEECRDGRTV